MSAIIPKIVRMPLENHEDFMRAAFTMLRSESADERCRDRIGMR